MAEILLRIIGESVIEVGERRVTPDAPHLFALLLFLAEAQGRAIPRSELIELLFDAPKNTRAALHSVRQLLYRLNLLGVPIELTDRAVRLDPLRVSHSLTETLGGSYDERKSRLKPTYAVLPHYAPPQAGRIVAWIETLRDRIHNALRHQFRLDIDAARERADWPHVEALARRALELDPLNESAVLGLAEAVASSGSKAMAISILDSYKQELGENQSSLALPAKLLGKRIDNLRTLPPNALHAHVRLVGRSTEMSLLLSSWESARRGRFSGVRIFGDKSVGKTRLAEELASSVTMNATGHVLTTCAAPADRDRPLSLFADLASQLLRLPGAAGCDPLSLPVLRRLSGSLTSSGPVRAEHACSEYEGAAVRNAFCDLLSSVSEERPILCIVDNAAELDEASIALLLAIPHRLRAVHAMFLACHGKGTDQSTMRHPEFTDLHLQPLDAAASKELLLTLMAATGRSIPETFAEWCLDVAAGNPGHLELMASDSRQEREPTSVPADLVALADRRIHDLAPEAQYALQALAVIGESATADMVAALTGLSTYELLIALHSLEDASCIVQTADGLRCRTMFIAERARCTASRVVISMMEGRAAALMEAEHFHNRWSPAIAWRIAAHWQNAGQHRKARRFLRSCWQHAVSIGHPMSAVHAIREALRSTLQPLERGALLDDLIGALQAAGDLPGIIAAVRERNALGSQLADSARRRLELAFDEDEARVMNQSTPSLHVDSLKEHASSSLLDARRRLRAARLLMIGADGELDLALASATVAGSQIIDADDAPSLLLRDQIGLIYHTVFGDRAEALRIVSTMEDRVRRTERSWYTFVSRRNCSLARQLVGSGETDYQNLERSYAEALDASMTAIALSSASHLTSVLIDDGNIPEARRWMRISESLATANGTGGLPMDYLSAQVDLALLDDNCRGASRFVSQMQKNAPRYESARLRNDLLIYRLRLRQLCGGQAIKQGELAALLSFHELAKRFGRHDDHMDVLWIALSSVGEEARASELLSLYLREHRRESRPCRYFLRLRTKSDPAWQTTRVTRVGGEQEEV